MRFLPPGKCYVINYSREMPRKFQSCKPVSVCAAFHLWVPGYVIWVRSWIAVSHLLLVTGGRVAVVMVFAKTHTVIFS